MHAISLTAVYPVGRGNLWDIANSYVSAPTATASPLGGAMQRPSPSTPAHRVRRLSIALAGLVAAFALLIPSSASAAAFTAKVHFPNHNPIAGKTWVITWTATKGATKLSGSDSYQFF